MDWREERPIKKFGGGAQEKWMSWRRAWKGESSAREERRPESWFLWSSSQRRAMRFHTLLVKLQRGSRFAIDPSAIFFSKKGVKIGVIHFTILFL